MPALITHLHNSTLAVKKRNPQEITILHVLNGLPVYRGYYPIEVGKTICCFYVGILVG